MGCEKSKSTPSGGGLNNVAGEIQLKCAILGNACVGKSSITARYIRGEFSDKYDVTLGGVYAKKEVVLKSGEKAWLHIWDTGGQQRYRAMAPLYYRDAVLALLVCSVDDISSLKALDYWLDELSEKSQKDQMKIMVAINKCDLAQRQFSKQQAEQWARSHGVKCIEVSAKTGVGINQLFGALVQSYVKK